MIALITDYGNTHYAGVLKAVIKSIAPSAEVIDIEHGSWSFSAEAGAYVLLSSYGWFPRGTVFVVVVDPGVGSRRRALAVEAGDYFFVGPDNGVLYPAVKEEGLKRAVELSFEKVSALAKPLMKSKRELFLSHTFHGRDLFAPAAALIHEGTSLEMLGDPVQEITTLSLEEGSKVIYVDKFGNVALSLRTLPHADEWRVITEEGIFRVKRGRTFSDVPPGKLVIYVNSAGFVEIAVNQGSAARTLGVKIGDHVALEPMQP
ncbi:MAG: SAM-dependent chlorinase/fluorinase [Acidilobaceae archaeon]|nr:SAM-dependent chlorinase/fluorinase [Acidilobaceae archaeon]MCX8165447.1 SAM-dependent chlorinase/fluorinase [Acidilobaceae archaeon]MDW7973874.1 SAM-dependent chlorinase/fluorinase [Sulfolobales archaeon]